MRRRSLSEISVIVDRATQRLDGSNDDADTWGIGAALIILVALLLLGFANGADLLALMRKGLGL